MCACSTLYGCSCRCSTSRHGSAATPPATARRCCRGGPAGRRARRRRGDDGLRRRRGRRRQGHGLPAVRQPRGSDGRAAQPLRDRVAAAGHRAALPARAGRSRRSTASGLRPLPHGAQPPARRADPRGRAGRLPLVRRRLLRRHARPLPARRARRARRRLFLATALLAPLEMVVLVQQTGSTRSPSSGSSTAGTTSCTASAPRSTSASVRRCVGRQTAASRPDHAGLPRPPVRRRPLSVAVVLAQPEGQARRRAHPTTPRSRCARRRPSPRTTAPSVVSMSTRVIASVPWPWSRMRTL